MKKLTICIIMILFIIIICRNAYAANTNYATSDRYIINEDYRYIYQIDSNTPVTNFYSNIVVHSSISNHIYDTSGNKKADSQTLATGDLLMFKNREKYTISVSKDLNGDGNVSISDMALLQSKVLNPLLEMSIESFLAADANLDDKITVSDIAFMQNYILNK